MPPPQASPLLYTAREKDPRQGLRLGSLLAHPCTLLGVYHPSLPSPAGSFTPGDACTGTRFPSKEAVILCAQCDASTCQKCFPFDEGVPPPPPVHCFPGPLALLLVALRGGGVLVPPPHLVSLGGPATTKANDAARTTFPPPGNSPGGWSGGCAMGRVTL